MSNLDIQLNKIIQSGVYYAINEKDGKERPYVIISKDQGYAMNILAFKITSKFSERRYIVPIHINGKISFIVCSETVSMGITDVLNGSFVGLLNPEVFNICTTMYISRFSSIDNASLNQNMCEYLDLLEDASLPLYDDPDIIFNRNLLTDKFKITDKKQNEFEKYNYKKGIKDPSYFNSKF